MKTYPLSPLKTMVPALLCVLIMVTGCTKDPETFSADSMMDEAYKTSIVLTDAEIESLMYMVEEEKLAIVRRKQVSLVPMSEEEANDQMELLGHSFFIFYNAESAKIGVLYRREDGNYGVLEPELT